MLGLLQLEFAIDEPHRAPPRRAFHLGPTQDQLPLFPEVEAGSTSRLASTDSTPSTSEGSARRPELSPPPYPTELKATLKGQTKIERFLRTLVGPRLIVSVTENRSTMISFSQKKGVTYLRLHALFTDAPEHVLAAVAQFVLGKASPKSSWLIDQWIEAHRPLIRTPSRAPKIQPRGEVHNLLALYDQNNERYFENRVQAAITWTRAAKRQRRSTIRMGSYCEDERLIRIHPALDQSFVPEFFVAFVVFHEMLHQLHGADKGRDGSRRVHTPAFRRDEKKFREYALARAWELKNIRRLLHY